MYGETVQECDYQRQEPLGPPWRVLTIGKIARRVDNGPEGETRGDRQVKQGLFKGTLRIRRVGAQHLLCASAPF